MSNNMDKFKLIAEVRKRPALWDINAEEHKSLNIIQREWKNVAAAMGSNVNECSRKWKALRSNNRDVVNKIELRIQEAKQKGSYNPNNNYGSKWTYLEHMKFMNDIKKPTVNAHKSDLEMSNAIDKFKLITEIQKRPAIWDFNSKEHRSPGIRQKAWKDAAVAMGSNVNECSRIWKYLRDVSRSILKKRELRIKEAKLKGSYNPNMAYITQWPYLEHMEFFHGIKLRNPSANENKSQDNDSNQVSKVHNMDNTKMEPERDLEMSNAMDIFKLIAEVRKRPALWDINGKEYKSKRLIKTAWKDVAAAMGSNVNDCIRTWNNLQATNRVIVKRIDLRIQEAKQKGSYNPNNDYGSNWIYLEHIKFVNDIKKPSVNDNKSDLEMSNAIDKFKLIAEIRKRPATWDVNSAEHRSQGIRQKAWKDVAVAMGSKVNDCSRMWKNLRNINQQVLKKVELRIQEAKLEGSYNPNNDYSSRWRYLEHMQFINGIKLGNSTVSKVHIMDNSMMEPDVDLKMSNAIDKFKFIDEVQRRPALWDNQSKEHRSKSIIQKAWKDLAVTMGSDVNDCRRMWRNLWNSNRLVVNEMESRIQKDKLNGSYNPNNDYSSKWPYLEHMKFLNDIKIGNSNAIDKFKLIDEMRKRPALWDYQSEEHRSCLSLPEVWKDLAVSMGSDVDTCQNNWINLCRSYRLLIRRLESRIKEAKLNGSYNPNKKYSCKWPYFEAMEFMKDNTTGWIKLRTSGGKLQLIAEVRNRPELWDFQSKEHRSCLSAAEVWKDLAVSMGSDVETCQRNWISLCRTYNRTVTRLELRIQEAKQKGSYNPNNDYSQWPYFEHMEFMKDNTTGTIKLCNSGDKFKLIAEVRKRPELWCIKSKEYMPRLALQRIWEDLAQAMGADVDDCKSKWTSLLLGYRIEVKKLELRIKEAKLKGSYNPNNECRSKWIFYERMKFCDDIKNPSFMELGNTFVNDNNSDDNDSIQVSKFQNNKMEPELDLEPEVYLPDDEHNSPQTSVGVKSNFSGLNLPENQDPADDKPTTSNWKCSKRSYDQANYLEDLEKEEHNLIKSTKVELGLDLDTEVYIPDDEDYDTDSQMSGMEFLSEPNSPQNQESADDKPSSTGGNCTKLSYDQANLLDDIEKEEHNLTKSAKVEVYIPDDEDDDTDSQMSGMEFLSEPNSPQIQESADDKPSSTGGNCTKLSYDQANLLDDIEKEEHNLTKSAKVEVYIPDDEDDDTDSQMSGMEFLSEPNSPQNQESADDKPSSTGGNCTKRSYDQANSLEGLEKDEHNLIKTVRSNEMVPVTDSDYNFLVSFLPKMKKINELQNLQFREKITDLMLDIAKE